MPLPHAETYSVCSFDFTTTDDTNRRFSDTDDVRCRKIARAISFTFLQWAPVQRAFAASLLRDAGCQATGEFERCLIYSSDDVLDTTAASHSEPNTCDGNDKVTPC
jgi:hypothetical protein